MIGDYLFTYSALPQGSVSCREGGQELLKKYGFQINVFSWMRIDIRRLEQSDNEEPGIGGRNTISNNQLLQMQAPHNLTSSVSKSILMNSRTHRPSSIKKNDCRNCRSRSSHKPLNKVTRLVQTAASICGFNFFPAILSGSKNGAVVTHFESGMAIRYHAPSRSWKTTKEKINTA